MFKNFVVSVTVLSLFFLCACSKEQKFGIDELAARMNKQYEADLNTSQFMLGTAKDGTEYFFSEKGNLLIAVFPDSNSTIKGIAVLANDENDISEAVKLYSQMCSVMTGISEEEQTSTLKNCGIDDKIKFADSTTINTVGKYKYVSVCNKYAVTLFCERV